MPANGRADSALLVARAMRHGAAGQLNEALACLDAALAIVPGDAVAHCRRGQVLRALRRWDEALASFDRGIALQPALAPAHMDRGNVLQDLGRLADALVAYDRALALHPNAPAALCNRGTVLHRLHRYAEAIAEFDAALALEPGLFAASFNRCTALADSRAEELAVQGFERILERHPELAIAHWNEALARLRLGDYAHGWPKFEWRWRYQELGLRARAFPQPLWLGAEEIRGRRILLHAEQGLGDAIQFCRYADVLADRGAQVTLEVQPPLTRLVGTLRGAHRVIASGQPPGEFDCHTPLLSLPLALRTTLETIPAATPYLHADPALVRSWAERLEALTKPGGRRRLRIGLAWSGNPRQPNDYNRSLPLQALAPLTALDAQFVALQTELPARDAPQLAALGVRFFGAELRDFADTAALAANLDLVVSACTSTAHLAGALGLPLCVMLCYAADWRWLKTRDDSPWYPGARLFRQETPGDWTDVVNGVRDHLLALGVALSSARPRGARDGGQC